MNRKEQARKRKERLDEQKQRTYLRMARRDIYTIASLAGTNAPLFIEAKKRADKFLAKARKHGAK